MSVFTVSVQVDTVPLEVGNLGDGALVAKGAVRDEKRRRSPFRTAVREPRLHELQAPQTFETPRVAPVIGLDALWYSARPTVRRAVQ